MKKICSHCKQEKNIELFNKNKNTKDKYSSWCKQCSSIELKKYYRNNKKKILKNVKQYRNINQEKIKIKRKDQYQKNRENILQQQKEYTKRHKEEKKKYDKKYREVNKDRILKRQRDYECKKRKNDINFKIINNLRKRVNKIIRGENKSKHTLELLGCTIEEFKIYIEAQFTEGMTWENYGKGNDKWNLDHIIPCASFKHLDTLLEQKLCFHYSNYQPLWQVDNFKKGSRIL